MISEFFQVAKEKYEENITSSLNMDFSVFWEMNNLQNKIIIMKMIDGIKQIPLNYFI